MKGKIHLVYLEEKLFLRAKREISMTIKSGKGCIAVDLMAIATLACMFIIFLTDDVFWSMSFFVLVL